MHIFFALFVLGGLGLLFGIGLGIAAKRFCVAQDPRLEKLFACLPGSNCGACGKPGCMGFAESLIAGTASITQCVVSDEEAREKLGSILNVAAGKKIKRIAVLHCHGGIRAKDRFTYDGLADCRAAALVQGGQKACRFGCLGFGTCVRACPFDAIHMGNEGIPVVDEKKCRACGKCVAACPKKLYTLIENARQYYTACKSLDLGKQVLDVCSAGCIGCGKCQKACPVVAISVQENLAVFDYKKCQNKGACFAVCPTKAIAKRF